MRIFYLSAWRHSALRLHPEPYGFTSNTSTRWSSADVQSMLSGTKLQIFRPAVAENRAKLFIVPIICINLPQQTISAVRSRDSVCFMFTKPHVQPFKIICLKSQIKVPRVKGWGGRGRCQYPTNQHHLFWQLLIFRINSFTCWSPPCLWITLRPGPSHPGHQLF